MLISKINFIIQWRIGRCTKLGWRHGLVMEIVFEIRCLPQNCFVKDPLIRSSLRNRVIERRQLRIGRINGVLSSQARESGTSNIAHLNNLFGNRQNSVYCFSMTCMCSTTSITVGTTTAVIRRKASTLSWGSAVPGLPVTEATPGERNQE